MRIGNNNFRISVYFLLGILILVGCSTLQGGQGIKEPGVPEFNSERSYQDVVDQLEMGPRIPGTAGHQQIISWLQVELQTAGWEVEVQKVVYQGKDIRNVIASRDEADDYLLIGAHYDTRIYADQDPQKQLREQPVPGANDGASGVAVLLELARVLPVNLSPPVKLVFFDAEDNGGIGDWDWILGSRAFVQEIEQLPRAAVIVDMVGDQDLNILYERNSDSTLQKEIWEAAAELGHGDAFLPEEGYSILDDHTPFLEAGIPAVDIIDFDYPYWHTTQDTLDKISQESLQAVGETLLLWLTQD